MGVGGLGWGEWGGGRAEAVKGRERGWGGGGAYFISENKNTSRTLFSKTVKMLTLSS